MKWFIDFLTSSIGRKLVMSLTGLFLCSFLIIHVTGNSLLFFNDGGLLFNAFTAWMEGNIIIRTIEYLLFAAFIIHILQSILITYKNNQARSKGYAVSNANANSKWYSRWMGVLGTLIFVFLVIHLKDFFWELRFGDEDFGTDAWGNVNLFREVKATFEMPAYAALYFFSMIPLAYHLMHGFQSGFRTLGIMHKKYTPLIETVGTWFFGILIPLLFALMPVYFQIKKMM